MRSPSTPTIRLNRSASWPPFELSCFSNYRRNKADQRLTSITQNLFKWTPESLLTLEPQPLVHSLQANGWNWIIGQTMPRAKSWSKVHLPGCRAVHLRAVWRHWAPLWPTLLVHWILRWYSHLTLTSTYNRLFRSPIKRWKGKLEIQHPSVFLSLESNTGRSFFGQITNLAMGAA